MVKKFSITQRVYFEDTDAIGVVYYANYLRFMERARSEWLWHLGFSFKEFAEEGYHFVIRAAEIDYQSPARLKDMMEISCDIAKQGNTSLTFAQSITQHGNPDHVYCNGKISIVTVNEQMRPTRIPKILRDLLDQ